MSETTYHLVHANVAHMRAPLDDPIMTEFVEQIDEIDGIAHNLPGFVAQPTPPDAGVVFKDDVLLNMSIWKSVESLYEFTYKGKHDQVLERRAEWFEQQDTQAYVLFWFPAGEIPAEKEVKKRIETLHQKGATPHAFTFEERFTVEEMLAYREKES
ncbi:DUF3291 domain-containing protein [candidate division TA06 bacterium]|nr:DUF3291 domain-containing protein [candidate division TA06 bacterium]